MTGVEELRPQIVEEVKPDKKEDVDAHPDHLQTATTATTSHNRENSGVIPGQRWFFRFYRVYS